MIRLSYILYRCLISSFTFFSIDHDRYPQAEYGGSDDLGDGENTEVAPVVTPEKFDAEAKDGIQDQKETCKHALGRYISFGYQQNQERAQPGQGVVDLGGMQGNIQGGQAGGVGEGDGPRQITLCAVATPGHGAADTADGLTQGDADRNGIHPGPQGLVFFMQEPVAGDAGQDGSSQKNQAAPPEHEHFQRMMKKIHRVDQNIEDTGSEDGTQDDVETKIGNQGRVKASAPGFPAGPGHGDEEGRGHKKTIAVNGQGTDIN